MKFPLNILSVDHDTYRMISADSEYSEFASKIDFIMVNQEYSRMSRIVSRKIKDRGIGDIFNAKPSTVKKRMNEEIDAKASWFPMQADFYVSNSLFMGREDMGKAFKTIRQVHDFCEETNMDFCGIYETGSWYVVKKNGEEYKFDMLEFEQWYSNL